MTDYDELLKKRIARRSQPKVYTEVKPGIQLKQVDWGTASLPPCDIMDCDGVGEFDTPTTHGPWASLCKSHTIELSPNPCGMGYHRIRKEP